MEWLRRSVSRPKKQSNKEIENKKKELLLEEEIQKHAINETLIQFINNNFTLHTFKTFHLQEENEGNSGEEGKDINKNVRVDLSEWQERHATLILSKSKVLSQLRFKLCPGHLKERQFWRIYFTLVKSYIYEYQLRAIQLAKLRQMTIENDASRSNSTYEVEMSETKQADSLKNGEE